MKTDSLTDFLKKLIRPAVAIILLVLLFRTGLIKMDQLKSSVQNTPLMISGFFLIGIQLIFFMLRWQIIVHFYKKISFQKIFKLNLISQFFNIFIPGGVGGDIVKALELSSSEKIPKQATIATVVIDRILGLYCMILFSTLFLLIELNQAFDIQKYFYTSLAMLVSATFGLLFLNRIISILKFFTAKIKSKVVLKMIDLLESIFTGLKSASNAKTLSVVILLSFWAQVFAISFMYLVVQSIVPNAPSLFLFFPLACFAFMASSIPITPGGIGFGQAAFYFIFSIFSKDTANAVVIGISLLQLFNLIFSLPGAYFFTKISKTN